MHKYAVKRLEPTDANLRQAAHIYQACFTAEDKAENWTIEESFQYLFDLKEKEAIFWAINDDQNTMKGISAGCPYENSNVSHDFPFDEDKCFYSALTAISPSQQGNGLGKLFFSKRVEDISELGYRSIIGRCRSNNLQMLRIYELNGFNELYRYAAELGGVTCERVILKKEL